MTPKEKAYKLFFDFYDKIPAETIRFTNISELAKQCTLIAVDELLNDCDATSPFEEQRLQFWNDVKNHIEKL